MSEEKLYVENGEENQDWPEPVKRAFLNLCWLADQYDFSVLCAVGFNRKRAQVGELALAGFFSPRASTNPHRAELIQDMARLFRKMAERASQ